MTCDMCVLTQEWSLTKSGNVKHSDLCLSVSSALEGERVKLKICDNSESQVSRCVFNQYHLTLYSIQKWKSTKDGKIHLTKYPDLCLDSIEGRTGAVTLGTCGESEATQRWFFNSS